jgi:hypothetical protein
MEKFRGSGLSAWSSTIAATSASDSEVVECADLRHAPIDIRGLMRPGENHALLRRLAAWAPRASHRRHAIAVLATAIMGGGRAFVIGHPAD